MHSTSGAGYVEGRNGRNVTIECGWAAARDYRAIAGELTQLKADAIITAGHPAVLAAESATGMASVNQPPQSVPHCRDV